MILKIGDKVKLINIDYPQYEKLKDKELTITDIAYNRDEHYYYDESMNGQALITLKEIDFCLYEYEFEKI